jgi:integrase/recombinase XerD
MDIAQLVARPHDMNVGDAARYLEGFAAEMASVGYSPLTIGGYLDSVIHFGGWLQARGLSLTTIDEKIVKAFGAHRCKCPGRRSYPSVSRAYVARVERFVRYLGQQGVIRSTVNSVPEATSSLIAFREWLLQHRGLAPVTVDRHEHLLKGEFVSVRERVAEQNSLWRGVFRLSESANSFLAGALVQTQADGEIDEAPPS